MARTRTMARTTTVVAAAFLPTYNNQLHDSCRRNGGNNGNGDSDGNSDNNNNSKDNDKDSKDNGNNGKDE